MPSQRSLVALTGSMQEVVDLVMLSDEPRWLERKSILGGWKHGTYAEQREWCFDLRKV
jgi:hypothetical protein